ncbi:MAG TPA: hypothetical protein VFJ72_01500 [Rubrobacteraceae bacterium]|nr:hypothetical protein [Rubrobacteraceae bacterium]
MTKETATVYGYTYGQASGNRVVEGRGRLPEAKPIDVSLGGTPTWVVGVPLEDDTAWVVAYGDGRVDTFRLDGESGKVEPWLTSPDKLPPGAPPAVAVQGERLDLITAPGKRSSSLTHPIRGEAGLLGITAGGKLFTEPGEGPRLSALPDARIVQSSSGAAAVLAAPTARYDHGILGDRLEAGEIGVLKPGGGGYRLTTEVQPESGGVFEALAPLWFRPGAGEDELLAVTESAERRGSRISVYSPDGGLVAAGPFINAPQQWRHLIAAGPFGPDGQIEIAAMRTPHIGGTTEFYRLDRKSGELELAATGPGYPSHTIYSRDLDAARAGDLDGDGSWELLVPNTAYNGLVALRHTKNGVEKVWSLPATNSLGTNIAAVTDSGGRIAVAVGTLDGNLRIWR